MLSGTLDRDGIGHDALIVALVTGLLKSKDLALLGGVCLLGQAPRGSAIVAAHYITCDIIYLMLAFVGRKQCGVGLLSGH